MKALKEASSLLSNHSEELQAAEELLREAGSKTQESNLLLLLVKANLKDFRVSVSVSFSIRSATTQAYM